MALIKDSFTAASHSVYFPLTYTHRSTSGPIVPALLAQSILYSHIVLSAVSHMGLSRYFYLWVWLHLMVLESVVLFPVNIL